MSENGRGDYDFAVLGEHLMRAMTADAEALLAEAEQLRQRVLALAESIRAETEEAKITCNDLHARLQAASTKMLEMRSRINAR